MSSAGVKPHCASANGDGTRPRSRRLPEREADAIPVKAFDFRAVAPDEHEQIAGDRVLGKQWFDQIRQAVDGFAHVDRLTADITHEHRLPSAPPTSELSEHETHDALGMSTGQLEAKKYHSSQNRFEVDRANEAAEFQRQHGISEHDVELV